MRIIFDTGSTSTWFNSDLCDFPICKIGKQLITQQKNKFPKETFFINYGHGRVAGPLISVDMRVKGLNISGQRAIAIKYGSQEILHDVIYPLNVQRVRLMV